ncbi:acyltransferase [Aliiglaciecola sp. LCG003]|uniref:acyltransferase n=1 Tax=Aliiglaciecola sp. LCG003 TaxID=3053655 RepID=UPI00257469C6|nr:acyltransferase [Aliiglaciecola sp. LCG003]WJG09895.1 acyltransferase [Aliiglaciecola sp. LCG003]
MGALLQNLIGTVSVIVYFVNTVFWVIPIVIFSFLKLIPIKAWQTMVSYPLDGCATSWITVNYLIQRSTGNTNWKVEGLESLTRKDWYLVVSNHQSWVDILVLQRIFNRKIPFLKFFLKKELIWVPFLGIAWWALDFPFMRRYSKTFLAKHPHLKGKDMESTRKACQKFQHKPVSIMNFVEGTRLTPQKLARQNSPFTHLLKPKAGGMAFVLSAMGNQLHKLLDVTIYYPGGIPTFWDFVCGKVKDIHVSVRVLSIEDLMNSDAFAMDYFDNPEQRAKFQRWLNQLWAEKDQTLKSMSAGN